LASSALMNAGTPEHLYFHDKQEKCLKINIDDDIANKSNAIIME